MIAVGSKSVKIAGSKSSKTAVAKTCVRLALCLLYTSDAADE